MVVNKIRWLSMNIPLVKRSYNSAKQLAEKFIKDEIKFTTQESKGVREYANKHLNRVKIETNPNGISISKGVASGHSQLDLYEPLITRTRKPNNTTETVVSLESQILQQLKKIITTVKENGKKTTKTEYQYWDNGYKRISPKDLYALIAKTKLKNASENVKNAVLDFLSK